jgi:signal transduction histidine kinase
MVQRIAAAHGGEIQLASEVGEGSTFTLLIPMPGPPTDEHYVGNVVLQPDREA